MSWLPSSANPDRYVLLSEGAGWLVWRRGLECAAVSFASWGAAYAAVEAACRDPWS